MAAARSGSSSAAAPPSAPALTPGHPTGIIGWGPLFSKEERMAKQITCRDAGMDCPGQFKVETEDELMQHLQIHGKVAHPDIPMGPEFQRQVKSLIKTV
jgi:predicted small metal-binding protein